MPTAEKTLRSSPWQFGQTVSASSVNFWTTSVRSPQSVQAYWYVGTVSSGSCDRVSLALVLSEC